MITVLTISKAGNDKFPNLMPHAQSRLPLFSEISPEEAMGKPTN